MLEALTQLILSIFQLFFVILMNPYCLIIVLIFILIGYKNYKEFKESTYYKITKLPFIKVISDKGRWGEYLTYKALKNHEKNGAKFLFNIYVPKEDGDTTEVDLLMISEHGMFVFESKNYSGWIFGSEYQKYWYQTLPAGRGKSRKKSFFNPVIQNRSHIKHLKTFIGEQCLYHSIIVFSRRCQLKNINIDSQDIVVIKRNVVAKKINKICEMVKDNLLSKQEILDIYEKLLPYTQCDNNIKEQHIINIKNKINKKPSSKRT